jgi:hypothetical protein
LLVLSLTVPAVTLAAVALPGLVIRHIPKLRNWWISHSAIAAAGVLLGIALLGVAYLAGFTESGAMDGTPYSVRRPSWSLLAAGWFVLAFFALHTWLPLRWGQQAVYSKGNPHRTARKPKPLWHGPLGSGLCLLPGPF